MMKKWSNIKGETLTETIIALSILAIAISVASTVVLNAMRNVSTAKQRVIAVNIAREGIEAMRSIRDTNWLVYSTRRRQCWNHDPGAGPCNPAVLIEPGVYVIYKQDDLTWQLEGADPFPFADGNGDLIEDNDVDFDLSRLSLVDIDNAVDSDGLDPDESGDGLDDDTDMYNHKDAAIANTYGTPVKNTPYRRYLIVEYLENEPDVATAPSNVDEPPESINSNDEWLAVPDLDALNRMRVTSVVEWARGGVEFSVELTTILTDHLGREELSS